MANMSGIEVAQLYQPYGPTDRTWHYGYNKDELDKLQEEYKYHGQRHIVSATWSEKDNGWIVETVSLEAYNQNTR
jgi:hypothetical protein